ncbi:hypothetical protein RDI58_021991 [Solanum bulbocastanum]|uniref:Uncharacterized protein n=1 Tax=Solanum bulbocastanum TaxID=147425 RepID=A0AAN8T776_SOLBU
MDNYILTCFHHRGVLSNTLTVLTKDFVKDFIYGNEFHVYVVHRVDELEEFPTPNGPLEWPDPVDISVGIYTDGSVENDDVSYLNEDYSDLNVIDKDLLGADTDQTEADTDLPSSDTNVNVIPDEDDSSVDEELRCFMAKRRNKRNPNLRKKIDLNPRKMKTILEEVPIGEVGVDRT